MSVCIYYQLPRVFVFCPVVPVMRERDCLAFLCIKRVLTAFMLTAVAFLLTKFLP